MPLFIDREPSQKRNPAIVTEDLSHWIARYENTAEGNDHVFQRFTALTDTVDYLKEHKDFVEANNWGMGFRAFHYLWSLLLDDCHRRFGPFRAMEIGIYMGQVISLWGLIARKQGMEVSITAVSPFAGNQPRLRWVRSFKKRFSSQYKAQKEAGSLYYDDDYLGRTQQIFEKFAGPFEAVDVHQGLSTDRDIINAVSGRRFAIVYIDGDHSYRTVRADIESYAPLVAPGGYLVMDDAAFFLPTVVNADTPFYRGYESVTRACEAIEPMGFDNLLNVGHNRVYRREGGPSS